MPTVTFYVEYAQNIAFHITLLGSVIYHSIYNLLYTYAFNAIIT